MHSTRGLFSSTVYIFLDFEQRIYDLGMDFRNKEERDMNKKSPKTWNGHDKPFVLEFFFVGEFGLSFIGREQTNSDKSSSRKNAPGRRFDKSYPKLRLV